MPRVCKEATAFVAPSEAVLPLVFVTFMAVSPALAFLCG